MKSGVARVAGRSWNRLLLLWALGATAAALWLGYLHGFAGGPEGGGAPPAEPADRLVLVPATFPEVPGWEADFLSDAVAPFVAGCEAFSRRGEAWRPAVGTAGAGGTAADWSGVCSAAAALPAGDEAAARAFFEANFRPYSVRNNEEPEGLFTGYFEPALDGSRRRHGSYQTPLYLRPPELVSVDLGRFRDDLVGRRLAGRLAGPELVPFDDRATIDGGALAGRDLELVWVDDPVDAFFLHIQGSGRVELDDGTTMRVGYAAQNGHPYVAIGRELVARGAMSLEEVSLQSLRRWLREHPAEAAGVMAANPSYVFFRELSGPGPLGSLGVALTAERSLAVDRTFLPLGAPMWVATSLPAAAPEAPETPWARLLIAQDTGGAIRGPVRGDIFWGHGEAAAEVAGRMRQRGSMWLLLPRTLPPRLPQDGEGALDREAARLRDPRSMQERGEKRPTAPPRRSPPR